MAKEIFLLDYEQRLPLSERPDELTRYAGMLKWLGVGSTGVQPMVLRPDADPYVEDAEVVAKALETRSIHTANFQDLEVPFVNGVQANAGIIGLVADALRRDDVDNYAGEDAQMVVLAPPSLSNEFIRLNPNGISKDYYNVDRNSHFCSRYHIEHLKLPRLPFAKIVISTGSQDPLRSEQIEIRNPDAISEGYLRLKEILDERAGWLLGASVTRYTETDLRAEVTVRTGPEPRWGTKDDHEWFKKQGVGKYGGNQLAGNKVYTPDEYLKLRAELGM